MYAFYLLKHFFKRHRCGMVVVREKTKSIRGPEDRHGIIEKTISCLHLLYLFTMPSLTGLDACRLYLVL
jgi:hypothetical protein